MNFTHIKKITSFSVILLFIGVAFAPSINANVSKSSLNGEFVEITVEFYGLESSNKIQLNLEKAIELRELIDNYEKQLSSVKNEDEAYEIYTQMLSTLEDYQIINSIQKKRLIFTIQHSIKFGNILSLILENTKCVNYNSGEDYLNAFCLTIIRTSAPINRISIGTVILALISDFYLLHDLSIALLILGEIFPTSFFRTRLILGRNWNKDVNIATIGLFGIKDTLCRDDILLLGFTGLILTFSIDFDSSPVPPFPVTDKLAIGWSLFVKHSYLI